MFRGGAIIKLELAHLRIKNKSNFISMQSQEVSRVHSTSKDRRKGRSRSGIKKLNPHYVAGFIDGEGCFWVGVYRDEGMRNKISVQAQFEIELRVDDKKILERIQKTLNCGRLYDCNYERYGWYPHVKFKIAKLNDIAEKLIPFLEKCPLQAKKAETFRYFKQAIKLKVNKKHLTARGVKRAFEIQEKIRSLGKKHRSTTARVR